MTQNEVAIDIRTQVANYYDFNWINRRGQAGLAIVKDLPFYLRQEIHMSYADPIWKAARALGTESTGTALRRCLAMVAFPRVSLAGETIVEQNQIAQSLFFLSSGEASVKNRDGVSCAVLKQGGCYQ